MNLLQQTITDRANKTITITTDSTESEEFASWLESQGYDVEYGIENAVDGNGCSYDLDASEIHNSLWDKYCNK